MIPNETRIKSDFSLITDLYDELVAKKKQNDQKLDKLLAEKPDCPNQAPSKPFELRDQTLSSLQILDDIPCDYEEWIEDCKENLWVARTLKLWSFCRKNFSVINKWAKWPDIVHTEDEAFFKKASKNLEDDVEEL